VGAWVIWMDERIGGRLANGRLVLMGGWMGGLDGWVNRRTWFKIQR